MIYYFLIFLQILLEVASIIWQTFSIGVLWVINSDRKPLAVSPRSSWLMQMLGMPKDEEIPQP